jgi:hypothetical protein
MPPPPLITDGIPGDEKTRLVPFEKPVFAAALLRNADTGRAAEKAAFFDPRTVSFRAAALANLSFWALTEEKENISFAWELGEPAWLPNPSRLLHL